MVDGTPIINTPVDATNAFFQAFTFIKHMFEAVYYSLDNIKIANFSLLQYLVSFVVVSIIFSALFVVVKNQVNSGSRVYVKNDKQQKNNKENNNNDNDS